MGHYGDLYEADSRGRFLAHWVPEPVEDLPELTMNNYVFALAHKRAAEAELKALKAALKTIRECIDD
jgi:hypothetical protein